MQKRGSTTIEVCGLNRTSLRRERNQIRKPLAIVARVMVRAQEDGLAHNVEKVGRTILEMTSSKSGLNYVGMRRAFFRSNDLDDFVAVD